MSGSQPSDPRGDFASKQVGKDNKNEQNGGNNQPKEAIRNTLYFRRLVSLKWHLLPRIYKPIMLM